MIEKIINFSVKNKIIIVLLTIVLVLCGIYSLYKLPVDAVPDITNNQVQIISQAPTLAANEVEQFITAPIEVAVVNVPDIVELRSISRLGLSVVTVVFKDDVDIYFARQQITERLKDAEKEIPEGLTNPELAPVSTGLGEIYQYFIHVKHGYEKKYNPTELRTVQDWIVRREMLGTPGVADVNSYGGFIKQLEISINPSLLKSMNVSISEIFEAVKNNNQNTGGAYIEKNPNAYFIRGLGLISSSSDLENIFVKQTKTGMPILIKDVARVCEGNAPRYGAFVVDTTEEVGGVVMMLKGKNASQVINGVKEKIKVIQKSLPEGLEILPYLDRTDLVDRAINTVTKNLLEGGLIVIIILVLFLGNLRAGFIVASVIPLSMLFAISMMNIFGISGNLMSLGAIDFGLIVDGAVIIVESVLFNIFNFYKNVKTNEKISQQVIDNQVLASSKKMMKSATFGQIIILIVYLPILALVGIEGKMFRPMAQTVSLAIIGALILSITYVPVVTSIFISKKTSHKISLSDKIMNHIYKLFLPVLTFSLKHKLIVITTSILIFISSLFVFNLLGGEFIPQLEEGDLAAGVMTLQGSSLSNTVETVKKANKILLTKIPEVKRVVCKIGTGEIPTDPTPMETGDYIICMKNKKEWKTAKTTNEMLEKIQKELSVLKGVVFTLQQPIQMRFNELMTGSKQDVAIKIFGDNLDKLTQVAEHIEKIVSKINGVEEINVEKVTGSEQIQVKYKRNIIAQYGLNISDVNNVLKTAFAGSSAGVVYDEEKRFDIVVRIDNKLRNDINNIKNLNITLSNGQQIPLEQVADISLKTGVAQVSRENTKRRIVVQFNVRNRDVESLIDELKNKIDKSVKLPAGYYISYGGQFENLVEAKNRLAIAVPVALLLIFVLLYFTFNSIKQSLFVFSAVPLSAVGGVYALFLRDMPFSISAGVGFIALFGVAVLNGIVLIAEFNRLETQEGVLDLYKRINMGIKTRIRPVVITALVASLGFLPMAFSTSAGAEVQKPLATVVIGGLISSTLLTLIILPVLYALFTIKLRKKKLNVTICIIALFFLGFFKPDFAYSQNENMKSYSLSEAIDRALQNSNLLKSAVLETEYFKKLKTANLIFENTNLDYTYGQSNSFEKDNNFTLTQSFPPPGTNIFQQKIANVNIARSQINTNITRFEIIQNVKEYYYNIQYYNTILSILNYQDSLFGILYKSAELKEKNGDGTLLEKISVQSQQMKNKQDINEAKTKIARYYNKLQVIVNSPTDFLISDAKLTKANSVLNADTVNIENSSRINFVSQQFKIVKLETNSEKIKLLPSFKIGYFNLSNKELNKNYRFSGLQVGIAVPILFFSQSAKVKASKINEQIALTNLDNYKVAIKKEYETLLLELNNKATELNYFEEYALKQSDLIILQTQKSYNEGNINYIELFANINYAISIKKDYLQSVLEYNIINSIIEKYIK